MDNSQLKCSPLGVVLKELALIMTQGDSLNPFDLNQQEIAETYYDLLTQSTGHLAYELMGTRGSDEINVAELFEEVSKLIDWLIARASRFVALALVGQTEGWSL